MKITDIKSFIVGVNNKNLMVVKVETDKEIYGIGQGGTTTREKAMAGIIEHIRHFLIGKDPRRIEDINQEIYRSQYYEGGTLITATTSAIDLALWDILGKHLNTPIWQLLGGASRNHVTCYIDGPAGSGDTFADQAANLVKTGWKTIRFTPETGDPQFRQNKDSTFEPWESIRWTAEQMKGVRNKVGPDIKLAVDYHHRLNVAEAAFFCKEVEDVGLLFLEEPIRSESSQAYAALRQMTPMPFAIGEEFSGIYVFAPFIEQGLANYVRLDICNVGGFTAARKVAAMAEAHYLDIVPHTPQGPICLAASVHLCSAIHNFAILEYPWETAQVPSDLFPRQPQLEKDHFLLPQFPGLGIEFNEEVASHYPPVPWETPHFRRRDGSFTNY